MAQWMNLQRIEKFENPTLLYITCGKSRGLCLAESGLMAGWQSGRLADKIWARLENKFAVDQNIRFSAFLSQGTTLF